MKVFSVDAETDGLWGNPFSVAAIVYENGQEVARFIARLSDDVVTNPWVRENVLPTLVGVPVTHTSYEDMLLDFSTFYMEHGKGSTCICHMGAPVEAHLFREMHRLKGIGDWDAPYPLHDVASMLLIAKENPTSVDAYEAKYLLEIKHVGNTHNPLYDCEVTAKVFQHLVDRVGLS